MISTVSRALAGAGKDVLAAKRGQGAPQFRLEDDHQRDGEERREAAVSPAYDLQVQKLGGERERDEYDDQAGQDLAPRVPRKYR